MLHPPKKSPLPKKPPKTRNKPYPMKNYQHIYQKVFNEPWLIDAATYDIIRETLVAHMLGRATEAPANIVPTSAAAESSKQPSDKPFLVGPNRTAIVPLSGIIGKRLSSLAMMCGGCCVDRTRDSFLAAIGDESVDTVILWGDTPGGTVTGVPEFSRLVYEAALNSGKQILGYTDTLCCSAGYYILSQCHEFLASPSAIVGSIGARQSFVDMTAKDAQEGVSYITIKSGPYKDTGNPHRKMEAAELAMLQEGVDQCAAEFAAAVNRVRDVDCTALGARVLSGDAALEANLVDSNFDTIDDLLEALSQV